MNWFRSKTKPARRAAAGKRPKRPDREPSALRRWYGAAAASALRHVWIIPFAAGTIWLVGRLETYLGDRPEFQSPPRIMLTDVPQDLHDRILALVEPCAQTTWTDPGLCRRIGRGLEASAWVERVVQVRRFADGTVAVSCDYRTPAALVQVGGEYYLLAEDGVRLPGRYSYHPSFVVLQGVGGPAPAAGEAWPGEDVRAGLEVIRLLRSEPFFDQLTGVLVENYAGRVNKREPHIVLATAPAGSRVVWGSAPGEEIEENTADQKLMLLWENYRRWGRIDAGRDYIDISTYPDRFTTRSPT